ncbi:sporulation-induced protein [Rhizina undulata]
MSVGEKGGGAAPTQGGGPDEWLEMAKKCKYLSEPDMKRLCELVKECLMEESNIQPVSTPVTVCGDIHGQFYDLLELFRVGGGMPGDINYVFLGDFVDRGYFSLETFTLLMCLKAKFPDRITLVRGNHESRQITQVYGFYEECQTKYGNPSVWKSCCQVFDFLALAAIIDGSVLCVHGGLSPEIRTLDQIRVVARAQEIPHEGSFCDLVWSDPEEVETWAVSPRGAGWLFGDKVASEFNHVNGLSLIARAHQLYHFKNKDVVTVWSAPNYCYRCGNVASIMKLEDDLTPRFSIFQAVPDDQRVVPVGRGGRSEYFL